jgi:hypothetical protein
VASSRARCITAERSAWVISAYSTSTSRTPGSPWTLEITSALIWPRSGQPAVVRATFTRTSPSGETSTSRTMPRSTMLAPSSGSRTPASMPRTAAASGVRGLSMGSTARIEVDHMLIECC